MNLVSIWIAGLFIQSLTNLAFAGARPISRSAFFFVQGNQPKPTKMAARMMSKLDSPSAERNKDPIWNVIETRILTERNAACQEPLQILEVAAGAGVHTHHFALKLHETNTAFRWYPTDPQAPSRRSEQAFAQDEPAIKDFVETPLALTLDENGIVEKHTNEKLEDGSIDWIININMIHISPWGATLGLMKVAGEKLKTGGTLLLYGPYRQGGTCVESNLYV